MKKILSIAALFLLPVLLVGASEPDLQLTGPDTLYSKDSFLLDFVTQSDLTQITFSLSYDTENLLFYGFELLPGSSWEYKNTGEQFILAGKSSGLLPGMRFQMEAVSPGTKIWVMLSNVVVTCNGQERKLPDIRWEHKVEQPVSGENQLSSLKISDAALQPAFTPYIQQYTATVSYHVGSIDVTAVAQDAYADVVIHNPELKANGTTDITVTVTAQNGKSRVYTISVTREDDPNRPLSSQCTLSDLVVNGFLLSPEFDSRATEYVLWLPYEVSSVEVEATPADSRATVTVEGNKGLKPGKDNPITVTCTAEDGTQKVYTVIAKRAPAHTEPGTDPATGTAAASENPLTPTTPLFQGTEPEVPVWTYMVLAVAAITGCAAVGILLSARKK